MGIEPINYCFCFRKNGGEDLINIVEENEYKLSTENSNYTIKIESTTSQIFISVIPDDELHQSYYKTEIDLQNASMIFNLSLNKYNKISEIMDLLDESFQNKLVKFQIIDKYHANLFIRNTEIGNEEYTIRLNWAELKDQKNNLNLNNIESQTSIKKIPKDLKFKEQIIKTNDCYGVNDIFEVFTSSKDNNVYIASPNIDNYSLDIISLNPNKVIKSIRGHSGRITTVRYFSDKNKEYLISADDDENVIIWDIPNDFKVKYKIETKYDKAILSCLIVYNIENIDYFITSTWSNSDSNEKSSTKVYSLENGEFFRYINNTNNNITNYLMSWYNQKDNDYYIIELCQERISINSLFKDRQYLDFKDEFFAKDLYCGYLYQKEEKDFLCICSSNGRIIFWDLLSKKVDHTILTNNRCLHYIIPWSERYSVAADYENKTFIMIDLEANKEVYNLSSRKIDKVVCIKKAIHPVYGQCLLTSDDDCQILLWI